MKNRILLTALLILPTLLNAAQKNLDTPDLTFKDGKHSVMLGANIQDYSSSFEIDSTVATTLDYAYIFSPSHDSGPVQFSIGLEKSGSEETTGLLVDENRNLIPIQSLSVFGVNAHARKFFTSPATRKFGAVGGLGVGLMYLSDDSVDVVFNGLSLRASIGAYIMLNKHFMILPELAFHTVSFDEASIDGDRYKIEGLDSSSFLSPSIKIVAMF